MPWIEHIPSFDSIIYSWALLKKTPSFENCSIIRLNPLLYEIRVDLLEYVFASILKKIFHFQKTPSTKRREPSPSSSALAHDIENCQRHERSRHLSSASAASSSTATTTPAATANISSYSHLSSANGHQSSPVNATS